MIRALARPLLVAAVVVSLSAWGRDLPNFHIRGQTKVMPRVGARSPIGTPGQVASRDERTGSPTFIWADPSRTSPAVSAALASHASVDAVARAHLADYAPHFGLSADAIQGMEVRQIHDTGNGSIIVRLAPRAGTLEIYGESLAVVMDRYRQPIAISGTVYPAIPGQGDAVLKSFKLKPEAVVSAAYRDLVGVDGFNLRPTGAFKGDYQYFELASGGAPERLMSPARAKPVAFRNGKGLEAAYYLELDTRDAAGAPHAYAYVVSAKTGQILVRSTLLNSAGFTYRVFADSTGQARPFDGPYGVGTTPNASATVNGTPLPAFVSSNLVTLDHGPISTGDPWLAAGATETRGNNVDAYSDTVDPDGFTGVNPDGGVPDLRADVTAPGVFDRTYDLTKNPDLSRDQTKAAITNLFYLNNWFHDWYYDVGFDEASGNAQQSNLGRASEDLAGDVFHAEADDSSGTDNANMFTPADGSSPRQQMYIWDGIQDTHLAVNSPFTASYKAGWSSSFGPASYNVTADVVVVNEGGSTLGCNALATNLTGKIALVDRGTCGFAVKTKNAQNAGAVGVIIVNTTDAVVLMGGTDPTVTIPALLIGLNNGAAIKGAAGTVNATLFRQNASTVTLLEGSFDGSVVAHEWGHYISHRLLAGGYGFNVDITDGMGEGWADFHALLLVVRPEDNLVATNATWNGVYALATYDTSGIGSGLSDPMYFGIRRYPYSTNMNKNPLTFKHITTGVALPVGVPVQTTFASADNAEVHNVGEIWATMLWECYAALLNAHPFQDAQDRMRGYIVAAYKATPPNPTLLEARDGLLAVVAASDGADYQLFGQAFAKRGLGTGAVAPDRFDSTNGQAPNPPLKESFVWAPDLYLTGATFSDSTVSCDSDGVLDRGEKGVFSLVVQNGGRDDLSQGVVTVSTASPGVTVGDGGVFPIGTLTAGHAHTVQIPVSLALTADAGPSQIDLDVAVTDPEVDAGVAATRVLSGTVSFRADTDDQTGALSSDDVEASTTPWTTKSARASNNPWVRVEFSPLDHAWFAEDANRAADESLISPPLNVGTGAFVVTFSAAWFEEFSSNTAFDGVVMEISDDDGTTWKDVKTAGGTLNPDYNVTIVDQGTDTPGAFNPIQGRRAWGNANPASVASIPNGFLTFEPVTASFGTGFANKTVRIRFRAGSDASTYFVGFYLDDISISGITNTPFNKLVADRLKCRPTADAGVSLTVSERATGTLPGSVTQTPGTTPPKLLWTQSSGPAITLSDATVAQPTFVAPDVPADTAAAFTLTATGIQGTSSSNLTVTIKDVNRPPVARITGPTTVQANNSITLSGSTSSDPDGDTLSYAWTQTSGTHVTLNGANTASMSFTAPDNSGSIGINLTVTDPKSASASASTTIDVQKKSGCSTSGGSPLPLLALLGLGLLARARRRTA